MILNETTLNNIGLNSIEVDNIVVVANSIISISDSGVVVSTKNIITPVNNIISITNTNVVIEHHTTSTVLRQHAYSYKYNKKLQYVIHHLLSGNINDNYPNLVLLFKALAKYEDDDGPYSKSMFITDNNQYSTIYPELIDEYFDELFNNVIDTTKYEITQENKRLFISISSMIHNLKGNIKSQDFLFKYMENIIIEDDNDDQYNIDKFTYSYTEDESWWETATYKPFTYEIKFDQPRDAIRELVESVHPAGFDFEFVTELNFIDELDDGLEFSDDLHLIVTQIPIYDGTFKFDGEIKYGQYATIIDETF